MVQTCNRCSRLNPPEAAFCFYDGVALPGHALNGSPGLQRFHNQFVFPSGQACGSFDELALCCQRYWSEACDLLAQGYLETFLGGQGRADLALAAREAAKFPDRDRGLDQFLAKLPTQSLEPPKLWVEQSEFNLGTMRMGEERTFSLRFKNEGMRLLYGSVATDDCIWLALGDAPGAPQKSFELTSDAAITVHVRGQNLRAANKPMEGRLLVESNGGSAAVIVRVEVPVKPFTEGVLAGAVTPRQIAERAKASPKEAAALFEKGAVEKWYQENGWNYPVQVPSASGIAAVQQFFEALGLTPPPKVELSEAAISLQGGPGEHLRHTLEVRAVEKKPVWAHAGSDQPWLRVGRSRLDGRVAAVPLEIPSVPGRPGEVLHANLTVTANGNQRFVVPVTLTVVMRGRAPGPAPIASLKEAVAAVPIMLAVETVVPVPLAPVAEIAPAPLMPVMELAPTPAAPVAQIAPLPLVEAVAAVPVQPARPAPEATALTAVPAMPAAPPPLTRGVGRGGPPLWLALTPALVLILALGAVILYDGVFSKEPPPPPEQPAEKLDPVPRLKIRYQEGTVEKDGKRVKDELLPEPTMRFGVTMLYKGEEGDHLRKLTFDPWGRTNNTCLRLDGAERLFGSPPGHWVDGQRTVTKWTEGKTEHEGMKSVWQYDDKKIRVTQLVELVRGNQSQVLDTCRVRYRLENQDNQEHRVGIRFLLDTYISTNDGVPFLIPEAGKKEQQLTTDSADLSGDKIPVFIQAYEREDLKDPGTIAHLKLKLDNSEAPLRVTVGAWPDDNLHDFPGGAAAKGPFTLYDVPVLSIKTLFPYDSAVTIYWDEKPLKAGASREVAFEYGMKEVPRKDRSSKLFTTIDGSFQPDGELTVTAVVARGKEDETVTLILPDEFTLQQGGRTQKIDVTGEGRAQITWKVKAGPTGDYELKVKSSTGPEQTIKVKIRQSTL